MPSFLHQVIVELFRNRETLAAELLEQVLRVPLPRFSRAELRETGLSELVPTDYWADLVVMLESDGGEPVYGVVVEVQLSTDRDKRWVWPLYATALRAKHRCPCCVLVVTPWPSVARWAAEPVDTGQPNSSFKPLVIGPRFIPRLRDRRRDRELARRNPELAVLSVLAHGKGTDETDEDVLPSVRMAAEAVSDLDYRRSVLYLDAILSAVSDAVRVKLEEQMRIGDYEIQNESVKRYYAKLQEAEKKGEERGEERGEEKGLVQGKLDALLRLLKGRGIELSEEQRETVLQCSDSDTLDRWLDRSLTAASADELFH